MVCNHGQEILISIQVFFITLKNCRHGVLLFKKTLCYILLSSAGTLFPFSESELFTQ